ncbi:MAG TPA: hypothetical protein DDW23_05945 [Planctomycetes bacterium]|nr:hypothetical protein [Planctomycetota bacterium]|tara:strand:+ start:972 stop:1352 length:381 start_codon:yes stop_codon:yes gene_type:complete
MTHPLGLLLPLITLGACALWEEESTEVLSGETAIIELRRTLEIVDEALGWTEEGLARYGVRIKNNGKEATLQWRAAWSDAAGFEVVDAARSWKPIKAHAGGVLQFKEIAPSSTAVKCRIEVRPLET